VIREAVLGIVQHWLVEHQPTHDRRPDGRGAAPQRTSGGGLTLIITGARTFTDYPRLCQVLAPDHHRIAQVLTGGARGAELLGYRWAWKHAVRHQRFRAEWERFGKVAGVRRNHQMAQAGDVLIVFGDGPSPGTAHLIQCMRALGKPMVVVHV
jgi:YspA, cpYpsA-related SLOG family